MTTKPIQPIDYTSLPASLSGIAVIGQLSKDQLRQRAFEVLDDVTDLLARGGAAPVGGPDALKAAMLTGCVTAYARSLFEREMECLGDGYAVEPINYEEELRLWLGLRPDDVRFIAASALMLVWVHSLHEDMDQIVRLLDQATLARPA